MKYFATFISGMEEVVGDILSRDKGIAVDEIYDGLVVFTSKTSLDKFINLRFLNNLFLLLDKETAGQNPSSRDIEKYLHKLEQKNFSLSFFGKSRKSFRIFISLENKTISVDKSLLQEVESKIIQSNKWYLNIRKPDKEFWLIARRDGNMFFGLRLTPLKKDVRGRYKGELRAELAHLLCFLADLKKKDIVLDSFAGFGAITYECANFFKCQKVYVFDKDKEAIKHLQKKLANFSKVEIRKQDFFYSDLPDGSVDKIITDPPWGDYEHISNLEEFYTLMFAEFERVLAPQGKFVLLSGAKETVNNFLQTKFTKVFSIQETHHILVSGKKCGVWVGEKM